MVDRQPAKHLEGFMSLPKESWDVLGDMGPFDTLESALEEIEEFRNDPRSLLLAVVDKQREAKGMSCFAGVYGLIEYNVDQGVSLPTTPALINVTLRRDRLTNRTSSSAVSTFTQCIIGPISTRSR